MAMVGLQADMQCSYFSRPYSNREQNSHGSSSIWPLKNVDIATINGRSIGSPTPSYPNQHSAYKEMLRQTMIHQEAAFRNQVRELHRLHKRQRELMDEMKRNGLNTHHLQLETLQMHPFLSQNSFESSLNTSQVSSSWWLNPAFCKSSYSGFESHLTLGQGKATLGESNPAQDGGLTKEGSFSKTMCTKVCKRILDLELPADKYIDSDEEEIFMGQSVLKMPVVNLQKTDSIMESKPTNAKGLVDLNEPLNFEQETDHDSGNLSESVTGKIDHPQVHPEGDLCDVQTRGDLQASSNILDHQSQLLQPLNKDETGQKICNSSAEGMHMKTVPMSLEDDKTKQAEKTLTSDLTDECSEKTQSCRKLFHGDNLESDNSSNSCPLEVKSRITSNQLDLLANTTDQELSSLVSLLSKHKHDFVRAPAIVQALPCFRASVELHKRPRFKTHEASPDKSCQDEVLECYLKSNKAGVQTGNCRNDDEFGSKNQGAKENMKASEDVKSTRFRNLDTAISNNSQKKAGEKKVKHASGFASWRRVKPANLANKKRRERTNTEKTNSTSTLYIDLQMSEATDKSGFGVLIDLNSCINGNELSPSPSPEINLEKDMQCPSGGESSEVKACRPSQLVCENGNVLGEIVKNAAEAIVSISSFDTQSSIRLCENGMDSLHWFARIASFSIDDPESEFGVALSCRDLDLISESSSDEFDYFEAMTLSLKECDIEEYCHKPSDQQEEPANMVELPSETKCSRLRRGRHKRKDFQSEVLPSLASLSRHEVTEDLYSIGLFDSAYNRRGGISRKSNETNRTRGRKKKMLAAPSNTDAILSTSSNQEPRQIKLEIELKKLTCWGKVTQRCRGKRHPAMNPWFNLRRT